MTTTETVSVELDIVDRLPAVPKLKRATDIERQRIAGHPSAFTVPFGSLRVADNIRANAVDDDIAELAADIREHGLLQPIAVRPYGVDAGGAPVFVIEAGHRRYNALRALKLRADDLVPVHPVTEASSLDRTLRQWIENVRRQPLTPIDEAHTIRTLTQRYELKIGDAAAHLGIDRNTASRRLLLLRLPEPAQQTVAAGEWEIEAAQLVGRLIRDDAPARLTDQLIADRCTRTRAQTAVDEYTHRRELDRLVANLEAYGFAVVSDPRNGPAPDGYRTEMHEDLDTGSVAAVKRLDWDNFETVTGDDGRPVVWVARSAADGKLHTYSLRLRELAVTAAENDDGSERLTHQAKEAGKHAMTALRLSELQQWAKSDGRFDIALAERSALHVIISRAHTLDIAALGRMIEAEPVMHDGSASERVDLEATAVRWFNELTDVQTTFGLMLITLMQGISQLGYADGRNEPASLLGEIAVQLGVSNVLDESAFRKVALHAAAKIEDEQS